MRLQRAQRHVSYGPFGLAEAEDKRAPPHRPEGSIPGSPARAIERDADGAFSGNVGERPGQVGLVTADDVIG